MNDYAGFAYLFDERDYTNHLAKKIRTDRKFTDTIGAIGLISNNFESCLLSVNNKSISYAALIRLGRSVATFKQRILFSNFVDIEPLDIITIYLTSDGHGHRRSRKLCKPQHTAMTMSRAVSFHRRSVSLTIRQRLMLQIMCSISTRRAAITRFSAFCSSVSS
jgi:hypothetical protein